MFGINYILNLNLLVSAYRVASYAELYSSGRGRGAFVGTIYTNVANFLNDFPLLLSFSGVGKKQNLRTTGIYSKQHMSLRKPNLHYVTREISQSECRLHCRNLFFSGQ